MGLEPGAAAGPGGALQWTPDLIQEFTNLLVEAMEEYGIDPVAAAARENTLLPESPVKEIVADAKFPKAPKDGMKKSRPRLVCKWLNRFGVSAEWAYETMLGVCAPHCVLHQRRLLAQVREQVAEAREAQDWPAPAP